jgi:hypothetical protein
MKYKLPVAVDAFAGKLTGASFSFLALALEYCWSAQRSISWKNYQSVDLEVARHIAK